jgi:hypothetical protein
MKARLLSMETNLPEINFRHAGLLPAGYTLVSGSGSRRHRQQNQFPSGFETRQLFPISFL